MIYAIEHIARTLKEARKTQGLSQFELSTKAGIPQSHISKIENGAVDLRISSLVELARVLELELEFVPRNAVTAVRAITRQSKQSALVQPQSDIHDVKTVMPAYSLDGDEDG